MTKQLSTRVKRQLFDIEVEPNNSELSGIVRLPTSKNDDFMNSDENLISDNNLELGENDYDSDCSLGSMNSLYLREFSNNTKGVYKNESNDYDSLNKGDQPPKKRMAHTITQISTEKKNVIPTKKLNVVCFYGQQKFSQQDIFSRKRLKLRQSKIKYMFSKFRKPLSSVCKFKQNIDKLRIRKKNLQGQLFIKRMTTTKQILHEDKNLIRNSLKIPIPLLSYNHKTVNTTKQNDPYSSNTGQMLLHNEVQYITNCETVLKKNDPSFEFNNIKRDLSELNTCNVDDFMDKDDFEIPGVDDIVKRLFEDSEDEINDQCSLNKHVSCEQTEQACSALSKPYDEPEFCIL